MHKALSSSSFILKIVICLIKALHCGETGWQRSCSDTPGIDSAFCLWLKLRPCWCWVWFENKSLRLVNILLTSARLQNDAARHIKGSGTVRNELPKPCEILLFNKSFLDSLTFSLPSRAFGTQRNLGWIMLNLSLPYMYNLPPLRIHIRPSGEKKKKRIHIQELCAQKYKDQWHQHHQRACDTCKTSGATPETTESESAVC